MRLYLAVGFGVAAVACMMWFAVACVDRNVKLARRLSWPMVLFGAVSALLAMARVPD